MKKIISFVLAALLLVSAVPTVSATNNYDQGTQVVYEATGNEAYTITVPAKLAPGGNGTVTLSGTWADNRIVTVTADPTVTLTNSIKADDQKVLNVNFDGISEAGSNTVSQTYTQGISVDGITDALFGTWSGKFNYNVGIEAKYICVYNSDIDGYTYGYAYDASGESVAKSAQSHTPLIPVTSGKTYSFTDLRLPNFSLALMMFDEDGNFIEGLKPNQIRNLDGTYLFDVEVLSNNYESEYGYITIPDGVGYIAFNFRNHVLDASTDAFYIFEGEYGLPTHNYTSALAEGTSNLINDSVLYFGDSIAQGYYTKLESYGSYIAEANNMNYRNFALAGESLSYHYDTMFSSASTTLLSQLTEDDFVIVEGFINEPLERNRMPVGELTSDGTTTFDTDTFIGLLEKMIYDYKQANYRAKLGFVLTYQVDSRDADLTQQYWAAAISVFEKYDIDYLNLYDRTYEVYDDGTHPTFAGQVQLAQDIELWMNSLG